MENIFCPTCGEIWDIDTYECPECGVMPSEGLEDDGE